MEKIVKRMQKEFDKCQVNFSKDPKFQELQNFIQKCKQKELPRNKNIICRSLIPLGIDFIK